MDKANSAGDKRFWVTGVKRGYGQVTHHCRHLPDQLCLRQYVLFLEFVREQVVGPFTIEIVVDDVCNGRGVPAFSGL